MSDWQIARHQVAIAGRVTDAETGKPMARAVVSISEGGMPAAFRKKRDLLRRVRGSEWETLSERLDKTQTRDDGLFWFSGLPEGKYVLSAAAPKQGSRYGKVELQVTVSRDPKKHERLASVDCALPPTGLRGKVTGTNHKAGVVMAEVRVKGSGEYVYTDSQGEYSLTRIEAGKRTVVVVAQGYKTKTHPGLLAEPGVSRKQDFELSREPS